MPRLSNSPRTPFTFDLERRKSYASRTNLQPYLVLNYIIRAA